MPSNGYLLSPEDRVLIRFIREEPLAPSLAVCKPEELSRLAIAHKVIALLASSISGEMGMPLPWLRWAAIAAMTAQRDARRSASAMNTTIRLLESAGVSPIVLKGISLAMGKPRDAGDIDLLIPEANLLESISILESSGYAYQGFERNMHIRRREFRDWKSLARWSNQFEFLEPDTGALIELHTAFFETERVYAEDLRALRATISEFIDSSVTDKDTGYRFLSLEDRALLLALHAGLKRSPDRHDFIARHITDLRGIISAGLDWDKLEQRAFRFGVAHHLVFLLRLVESLVGPYAPSGYIESIESRLSPRIVRLQRLHARCLRSLDSYDRIAIFAYRLVSPFILHGTPSARLRSLFVFPLFFPPRYTLASIYGLPQRSRLTILCYPLEPARLLYRLIRRIFKARNPS